MDNVLRMSNIGKCMYDLYMQHYHGRLPVSQVIQAVFDEGNRLHELIQARPEYSKAEKEIACEIKTCGFTIIGHADIVSVHKVIEIKSISKMPSRPIDWHIRQVTLYMHALNKTNGVILYHQKSDGKELSFPVAYSSFLALECVGFFEKLHYHIQAREEPECFCYKPFVGDYCKLLPPKTWD